MSPFAGWFQTQENNLLVESIYLWSRSLLELGWGGWVGVVGLGLGLRLWSRLGLRLGLGWDDCVGVVVTMGLGLGLGSGWVEVGVGLWVGLGWGHGWGGGNLLQEPSPSALFLFITNLGVFRPPTLFFSPSAQVKPTYTKLKPIKHPP